MMDLKSELGVQSYCFRHFKDNARVIELVKECDLAAIELCGVHVDFNDESIFDDVIGLYADAGVRIVSIGCENFRGDEAAERKRFEFVRKAGASFIAAAFHIDAVPEAYRVAEKLSDEYGVRLAIHNHGGRDWLGNSTSLGNAFANTTGAIGLCLDTAWALAASEDPVKMAGRFAERLYGLHFKDFVFDRVGRPEDVVIGTGALDLPGLIGAVKAADFSGYAVIEYEGDVENPVPAIRKCVEAVRGAV